jgi:hypothetical protein
MVVATHTGAFVLPVAMKRVNIRQKIKIYLVLLSAEREGV